MGLFDGRGAHRRGVDRARRAAARRAGGAGRRRARRRAGRSPRWCTGSPSFDPGVRLAGVILNRVGSDRHEEILRDALAGIGVPVLGALRRGRPGRRPVPAPGPGPGRGARTRGQPAPRSPARRRWSPVRRPGRRAGAAPARRPRSAPGLVAGGASVILRVVPRTTAGDGPAGGGRRGRGGVHVRLRRDGGAAHRGRRGRGDASTRCATRRCRRGTGALVLGGGFPEVHAGDLSANEPLRADGGPAGPLGRPGRRRVRRAALPGPGTGRAADVRRARRHRADDRQADPRLPRRGRGGRLGAGPRRARGPRSRVPPHHRGPGRSRRPPAWTFGGRTEGFVQGGVHASYLHLHWAGARALARRLVAAAADGARRRWSGSASGPGDPELVTVKAVRVLREADLVLVPVMGRRRRAGPGGGDGARARDARPHRRRGLFALSDRGGARRPHARPPGTAPRTAAVAAFAGAALRSRSPPSATRTSTPRSPTSPRPSGRWCPACTVRHRARHHRHAGPGRAQRHRAVRGHGSRWRCCR